MKLASTLLTMMGRTNGVWVYLFHLVSISSKTQNDTKRAQIPFSLSRKSWFSHVT